MGVRRRGYGGGGRGDDRRDVPRLDHHRHPPGLLHRTAAGEGRGGWGYGGGGTGAGDVETIEETFHVWITTDIHPDNAAVSYRISKQ